MTNEDILRRFRETGSVKRTSFETGVSAPTVRRILITAGEIPTARTAQITELAASGMSEGDIAKKLNVREKTVRSYLPYKRGCYAVGEKTANAERIRRCRARKEDKKDG